MSSSRRNKFEIWSEVLEYCLRTKRTQTWLLRKTRLKTDKIKETLEFLLSRQLIGKFVEQENTTYKTTLKGEEALIKFYNLLKDYFDLK